jgi:hypothetical protein
MRGEGSVIATLGRVSRSMSCACRRYAFRQAIEKIVPPTMLLRTHVVREQACCMLFPSTDLANASTSTGAIVSTSTVLNCNCHLFSFLAIVCIKVSTSVSGVLTVWNPAARISARVC